METTHSNNSTPIPTTETHTTRYRREGLGLLEDAIRESTAFGEYVHTTRFDETDYVRIDTDRSQHLVTGVDAGAGGLWFTERERIEGTRYSDPETGLDTYRYRAVRRLIPWQRIKSVTVLLATQHTDPPY